MRTLRVFVDSENISIDLSRRKPPDWKFLKWWFETLDKKRDVSIFYFINPANKYSRHDIAHALRSGCQVRRVREGRDGERDQLLDREIIKELLEQPDYVDIALVSHDGDFAETIELLHKRNPRRVMYVICKPDNLSFKLRSLDFLIQIDYSLLFTKGRQRSFVRNI